MTETEWRFTVLGASGDDEPYVSFAVGVAGRTLQVGEVRGYACASQAYARLPGFGGRRRLEDRVPWWGPEQVAWDGARAVIADCAARDLLPVPRCAGGTTLVGANAAQYLDELGLPAEHAQGIIESGPVWLSASTPFLAAWPGLALALDTWPAERWPELRVTRLRVLDATGVELSSGSAARVLAACAAWADEAAHIDLISRAVVDHGPQARKFLHWVTS